MKMKIKAFFLLLIFCGPLALLAEKKDDIVVHLSTESRLLPLYLSDFEEEKPAYSSSYLKQLDELLQFDLMHNGSTHLVPTTDERESFVKKRPFNAVDYKENWPGPQIFYLVRTKLIGDSLSARVVSLGSGKIQGLDLKLSGIMKDDRGKIHELADLIYEALFGKKGIAQTKLLYTVRTENKKPGEHEGWLSEVWECDWDGQNTRQLTFDGSYCVTPNYLPPKQGFAPGHFFYVSYQTGQPKVYIGSLERGPVRRFTYIRGNQLMPTMANTRDQVAFICDAAGNPDLFLQRFSPEMGAMGKPFQIYASEQGTQASPTFDPTGKKVAFVSNKDGMPRIYMMDVPEPGTPLKYIKPRVLTKLNRENTAPAWSPDGTMLAYSARTEGTRQIWIYDFRTGNERQLTEGPGHKENPSWAPDSLHLVFNSANIDSSELFIINLNQPKAIQVSSGKGEKRFPSWEPRLR